LDVRARNAFFSSYVSDFLRRYNVLAPLSEQCSVSGHLSASIDAVSLAFMDLQLDAPNLKKMASERYVVAVRGVGRALRLPHDYARDETLQSVLLLDIYEKMVNRKPELSVSWMSHVRGAMSLVEVCGQRNFSSHTGRQLAARLVVALTISCGAANARIPDALVILHNDLAAYIDDTKWPFMAIVADIVNFKADCHAGRFHYPSELAERARDLDARLESLEKCLPASWMFRRKQSPQPNSTVFGKYYDVYEDHFVTQVRNAIRSLRLWLIQLMQRYDSGDDLDPKSYSSEVMSQISEDICAAVPQFLLPGARTDGQIPFSPLRKLQCFSLLPSLYIAGQLSPTKGLRDWVIRVMNHMADAGNMKIAKNVADMLKNTSNVDYWDVYAMLGCYAFAA
jgi:hypothetical protein